MACRTISLQPSNIIHRDFFNVESHKVLYFPQNHTLCISKVSFHHVNVTTNTPIPSIIHKSLLCQFW